MACNPVKIKSCNSLVEPKDERATAEMKCQKLVAKPSPIPFCPYYMRRYENFLPNTEYLTVWVCEVCMTFILSEAAVINHWDKCIKVKLIAQNLLKCEHTPGLKRDLTHS